MTLERARVKQHTLTKTANYELLEDILESIKSVVEDQKYNFQQYVKAAQNEGLTQAEIWTLAKETLASHVSLRTLYRWAHEYLTEDAFMKVKQRAAVLSHKDRVSADMWQQDLKQQVQGLECESCVEAYEIEKVRSGVYTYEYLQQVAIWLHETLELNCRGK